MIAPRRGGRVAVAVIFATILLDFVGFSILIPVLPLYARRLGASGTEIGLILSLYALGLVLFLPLWGWASDRVGRRPVLLVSLLGTAGSFVLLAVSTSLWEIFAARILGGFFGASIGTAQAYMADLTDEDERAEGMGLLGTAFGLGFIAGNALGGLLTRVHPSLPFYATAAFALGNFVLAWYYLPESRPVAVGPVGFERLRRVLVPAPLLVLATLHDTRFRVYLLLFFLIFASFSAVESIFPLFTVARFGWTEWETGLFLAYVGIVLSGAQALAVGPLVREFGERRLLVAGLALTGLSMLALATAGSVRVLFGIGLGVAIGLGLAFPTFTSLFSQACGEEERGELLSQSQAMAHTGRGLGPLAWGALLDWVARRPDPIAEAGLWTRLLRSVNVGAPFLLGGLGILFALGVFLVAARVLLPSPRAGAIPGAGAASRDGRARWGVRPGPEAK